LKALTPAVVSSVDSGNLVASLWTLQQGSADLLKRPLFSASLADGLLDHFSVLCILDVIPRRKFSLIEEALRRQDWLTYLPDNPDSFLKDIPRPSPASDQGDTNWFLQQAEERIRELRRTAEVYSPCQLEKRSDDFLRRAVERKSCSGSAAEVYRHSLCAITLSAGYDHFGRVS
jgi:hypothetical protein